MSELRRRFSVQMPADILKIQNLLIFLGRKKRKSSKNKNGIRQKKKKGIFGGDIIDDAHDVIHM